MNAGVNWAQSTSVTVTCVSAPSTAWASARIAWAGSSIRSPRRRICSPPSPALIPPPSHGPHATDVAASPRDRRLSASASKNVFAAA